MAVPWRYGQGGAEAPSVPQSVASVSWLVVMSLRLRNMFSNGFLTSGRTAK